MEAPDFWNDVERSNEVMKTVKSLKDTLESFDRVVDEYEELGVLIEMADEEDDASLLPEIEELLENFKQHFETLRIATLLSGEFDRDNAVLTLHAGAGGTESCDWTGMLLRMYTRWAEKKGYTTEILDYLEGDEAGVKSVTIQINGENAYGYLKSE